MNTKEVFSFPITLEKLREIEENYKITFPQDVVIDKAEQLVESFAWLVVKKVLGNIDFHPDLDVDQFSAETKLSDHGFDSWDRLEFLAKIEELLDITVFGDGEPVEEDENLTIGAVLERIKNKLLTP